MVEPKWVADFHLKPAELSCFIGTLFSELDSPCENVEPDSLTLQGVSFSGKRTKVIIKAERFSFFGDVDDYRTVRESQCLLKGCEK